MDGGSDDDDTKLYWVKAMKIILVWVKQYTGLDL